MNKKLQQVGMNSLVNDAIATSVEVDDKNLWVFLADGRQLGVPLVYFPRLLGSNKEDLNCYELSGGGKGIHWEKLDEDISVQGLLAGRPDQTKLGQQPL